MMRRRATLALALAISLISTACTETRMMTKPMNSPKIDKLFEKTKPVCFGRFVIDVPVETKVLHGTQDFSSPIETVEHGAKNLFKLADAKRKELDQIKHLREAGSLLREFHSRPTEGDRTILFRKDDSSIRVMQVWGYLSATPHAFIVRSATAPSEGRTETTEKAELAHIAANLRARVPEEIPTEPGVCLDLGFIADDTGKFQEIFGIGFRFPSLPDVSLSISSNKDGQTPEPLSKRRKQAEKLALDSPFAAAFSKVKVLREGPRKISQWDGEEALFRRPREEGGVWHELRYSYPGIRYDHRNPRLDATLFTGVERNTAGALESSLSDEEAIALWDRMLATLRLRVPAR